MKNWKACLAAVMVLSLLLTGCAKKNTDSEPVAEDRKSFSGLSDSDYVLEQPDLKAPKDDAPVLQEIKELTPPTPELQFFDSKDLKNQDQQEIEKQLWSIVQKTAAAYSSGPYLISRVSSAIGGITNPEEELTDKGVPVVNSYTYHPYYDEAYRIVDPSQDSLWSLFWNEKYVEAVVSDDKKADVSVMDLDPQKFTLSSLEAKDLPENMDLQYDWITNMLEDGVYIRTLEGKPMTAQQRILYKLCNAGYFEYQVLPVIGLKDPSKNEEEITQDDYVLKGWQLMINLRDAQKHTNDLYAAKLITNGSIGQMHGDTINAYENSSVDGQKVILRFNNEGILNSSFVDLHLNFVTRGSNNLAVWNAESVTTRWNIHTYQQGAQWKSSVDQMMNQEVPVQFLDKMKIVSQDEYSNNKK